MLKLIKWVYDHGIQSERQRIKSLVVQFSTESQADFRTFNARYHDPKTSDEQRIALARDQEVREKALNIVHNLLWKEDYTYQDPKGYSPIDAEQPKK